jgi:4-aminobutyrate aminotransferase/diaminobutyrate-pyruvate transaminase/4-aminobutyrate aminotransferase/(S)-3-amino-2-methylpropionate transaminase
MFCFEHYGIRPDLIACGKGISSSLPLSAVIGTDEVMSIYAPGSMTSTHSASPLAVAAALANLRVIETEGLIQRAEAIGHWFIAELTRIQRKRPEVLGCCFGRGLVAGIQAVKRGTMFAPVGIGGECIKIAPPLTIQEEALRESVEVFEEAVAEVCSAQP